MILGLMVTEQCNFYCGHCMINSKKEYSCVSNEIINKYVKLLIYNRPDKVHLLGGEPFLHLDIVKKIVQLTKPYCDNILVYSNGSFLLDEDKANCVRDLKVNVRISDDKYHRIFWSKDLEKKIYKSNYQIIRKSDDFNMFPIGRAYQEYKHLKYNLNCSLISGVYDESYRNHNRYMIMLNGDVNLYCAALEAALANVFVDKFIDYELLIKREKILHNYLFNNIINKKEDTYIANMCNLCSKYKIDSKNIYFNGKVVANIQDYT